MVEMSEWYAVISWRKERSIVFFFQAKTGIRDIGVTGVQTCALPICPRWRPWSSSPFPLFLDRWRVVGVMLPRSGQSLARRSLRRRYARAVAAVVDATFRELAGQLEGRLEAILEAYWERVREEMPEFFAMGGCVVADGMRVARESIQTELAHLGDGGRLPKECPAADVYFAERAAELGVSPLEVVRGYRRGQAVQWEAWHELV